jgi:hypothetical protein
MVGQDKSFTPTLVLVEDTKGNIFGGYTPVPWKSSRECQADPSNTSLLFSVRSPSFNHLQIFRVKQGNTNAIYDDGNCGPMFGDGRDLCIWGCYSYSNLGHSYANHTGNPDYLTGGSFLVHQLEVYAVNKGDFDKPSQYGRCLSRENSVI